MPSNSPGVACRPKQVETAISIALSCKLFTEEMALVEVRVYHVACAYRRCV
jgi:hypothetical protein